MASTPLPLVGRPAGVHAGYGAFLVCLGLMVCVLFASWALAAQEEQRQPMKPASEQTLAQETPPSSLPGATPSSADHSPNAPLAPTGSAFSWSGYFYAIGALCLILAGLWAVLWLMRRSGKFRFMPASNSFPRDALRIEAQIPLGPRRGLMVVRFLNKRLLLGLSDQHIHLLSEAEYDGQASANFTKALEEAERRETDA